MVINQSDDSHFPAPTFSAFGTLTKPLGSCGTLPNLTWIFSVFLVSEVESIVCICFQPLTLPAQRPERRGEILWQFCLQQEEECAGVGDPSGLHVVWDSEICGELGTVK